MAEKVRFWTAQQLRDAIERCNRECSEMLARHARPGAIEGRRKGVEHLMLLLQNAEREEREAGYVSV